MARIHGRKGQISIAASETPQGSPADNELTPLSSMASWNISFARDSVDVTSFGDTNKVALKGLPDVSGGFEGFFDTADVATIDAAADDTDGVWIRITPNTDYPEYWFQGPAWLDYSSTGAVGDAVKVSCTFTANGAWQKSFSS